MGYSNYQRNKFGARRTNGFASALENAVYQKLLERQVLGEISNIKMQSTVTLIDCDKCGTRMTWKVDFSFEEDGKLAFAEAKGVEDKTYRAKLKRWREIKPAKLYIYKGSWRNPKLVEVIE